MKKIIFSILLLSSFCEASMLLDKSYPVCIEDYYVKSGSLYYLKSSSMTWSSTTSDKLVQYIYSGYTFESNTTSCVPNDSSILGISSMQFNFLMALSGVLFGFSILFYSIQTFMIVGTKK